MKNKEMHRAISRLFCLLSGIITACFANYLIVEIGAIFLNVGQAGWCLRLVPFLYSLSVAHVSILMLWERVEREVRSPLLAAALGFMATVLLGYCGLHVAVGILSIFCWITSIWLMILTPQEAPLLVTYSWLWVSVLLGWCMYRYIRKGEKREEKKNRIE